MGKIEGSPFPVLSQEPLLSVTAVYACTVTQTLDTIKRSVRNYMPRTYAKFLEDDVVVLCDANKDAFRTDHFRWMRDGVLDEGQGLVMVGGAESFADIGGYPSWKPTEVADILPCEMMEASLSFSGGSIQVLDEADEFIKSLPFDRLGSYGFFYDSNNIEPRSRARLIAALVRPLRTYPFLIWWDIGKGRTMAQSAGWQPVAGNVFRTWEYYGDYAINMMLFLAGRKLPEDLEMVYIVRRRMREMHESISMIYSVIDMVEKFGGSGQSLNEMVAEMGEQNDRAKALYFEGDLDRSLEAFAVAQQMAEETMVEALEVRDAAAFWIFMTEWAAVTGTSLLAGSLVWLLMVRRRLYREVAITRLRPY